MPGTTGIGNLARSVGKPGRQQPLARGERATITGGDPLAHSMGHYGKNQPPAFATMTTGMPDASAVDPTQHPGVKSIRGGEGGLKRNPREGALGPGKAGVPGGSNDYSMQSQDAE
jgi:hypothetical protein